MYVYENICRRMFIAALFTVGKIGDFHMLHLAKLVNYKSVKDLLKTHFCERPRCTPYTQAGRHLILQNLFCTLPH